MMTPPLMARLGGVAGRLRGLFNLNDGRWGRGDSSSGDKPADGGGTDPARPQQPQQPQQPQGQRPTGNSGPPDLDELWRDFNRKLGGLFGGQRGGGNGGGNGGGGGSWNGGGGGFQPDMKQAGIGVGVIAAVLVLIWFGTGFFIVQEGQQAVITRFGRYLGPEKGIKGAGINWRAPWPIERHEIVRASQLRSVEIGRNTVVQNTGLRDSSMLTQDENIVDVRFVVQYRVKDASEFLFNNLEPDQAVVYAAESAIREVVGRGSMNVVLNEKREAIAGDIVKSIQNQLDQYKAGIIVSSVNIQNVQPPEQVQSAFDDALKAGQDGDRAKNEGQAYANEVIPRAEGTAARLKEEAEGYKARVVAQAEGDAQRFRSVLTEYQKAPQVTRDRMYLDAMQQIYSNVTKVMVDARQGSNLLYLPLDKLLQVTGPGASAQPEVLVVPPAGQGASSGASAGSLSSGSAPETRSRDTGRSRDREGR